MSQPKPLAWGGLEIFLPLILLHFAEITLDRPGCCEICSSDKAPLLSARCLLGPGKSVPQILSLHPTRSPHLWLCWPHPPSLSSCSKSWQIGDTGGRKERRWAVLFEPHSILAALSFTWFLSRWELWASDATFSAATGWLCGGRYQRGAGGRGRG